MESNWDERSKRNKTRSVITIKIIRAELKRVAKKRGPKVQNNHYIKDGRTDRQTDGPTNQSTKKQM